MKKRLLSALLALALVFVLLPTTALAETPAIKIAGTVIEDGKYYYTNGGIGELKTEAQQKTWNVRRDGNTLYLKNAKINTTDTQSIQVWMMSVTINLEGDSTITTKGEGSIVSQFAGSLTIKGNGKLTIESNTAGSSIVWNSGDVTITGDAVVNITNKNSGQLSEAIGLTNSYELTVSGNAKLKAVSNGSKAATVNSKKLTIADNAEFNVINQNSSGKAVSFKSIEVAAGYDCNGINGNGITDWTKTTAEELNTFQKVWVKPTPTPTLEKSNVYVAGTNLYKNTAYTIQNGKPVMGGTYPGNYNIYFDATDYVLHVKDAVIEATGNARGTTGIYGTSNIVFEGDNSITASTYGIYSYFTQSDLKISGTGSLNVKTIAAAPAIATDYNTSRSIIISGNHFTVTADTSETTSCAIKSDKDLKITDGAAVIAKSNATRAIDIKGNLTVTSGSLKATSTSDSVPTVQVGGDATFTGSTVTITNNSPTQGEQYKDSNAASSALHVNGAVTISGGTVTAEAKAGGNAIRAVGNITVSNDATVTVKNNSQYFNAITAGSATGGEVNTLYNLIVSGENTRITATNAHDNNLTYGGAINAYIKNANEGHYLQVGTDTKAIAPNVKTTVRNNSLTITRGDEVARTESPVVIAGTTLRNDTYYTITNGSTVAEGTENNYNAFYDSATKTLKLNNAQISHSFAYEDGGGQDGAIIFKEFENYFIELSGENTISSTNTYAINCHRPDRTLTIKNAAEAENAKLTLTSNWMVICSIGGLNIQSDVTMVNTKRADYLMYVNGTFSYTGYNAYASTEASGSPLEVYNPENYSTYKYLRVTTRTLETGGGSTHQHVWDEAWHDTGDYHHAHQCTICKAYDTTTQELHNVTGHRDNHDGSHSNICGSCGYSAKVSHSYTWAPNANDNEKHIGTCVCGNVVEKNHNFVGDVCSDCGYDKSTGTTCEHVWTTEWTIDTVDNEYHWHKCIKCNAITDKKPHAYTIVTDSGTNHIRECECKVFYVEDHISSDWIIDTPATATTAGSMHKECTVCKHKMQTEVIPATGEIVPPTPDNPGTIVIIRPAEEEKPAQQPNPSTGANDLVGLAVAAAVAAALGSAAAVAAALGSAALLRKHD